MMEFKKYNKIYSLGYEENKEIFLDKEDIIYIQEKMDGANFRFYINNGEIIFGSRGQQLTSDEGEDTNMQKNFLRCVNHVREQLKNIDLSGYNGLIFYGECMIKHTIGYNWDITPPFLGFDIYDTKLEKFLETNTMSNIYSLLGLDTVPLLNRVRAADIKEFNDDDVPKSKYYSGQAEGVVFKNYSKQLYAKYVRKEFKEKNKEEFGKSKKETTTDEEYFTAVYCTNARIEKCVWKLMDEDNNLELKLMPLLIKKVYKDIWEEHLDEIINMKQKTINFDKLKKSFTKRCFIMLSNIITNNAINKQ